MQFSVVIPAYNEERRLSRTLESIIAAFLYFNTRFEVIVCDDGSTDRTAEIVENYQKLYSFVRFIRSPINYGKGHAVKQGMLHATGRWILVTDSDLSAPIEEFAKLWYWAQNGHLVVIGSRRIDGALIDNQQPWLRRQLGMIFSKMSSVFLSIPIEDFTCGFKLFHRSAAKDIFSQSLIYRWGFDCEALFLAHRLGYSVKEVPIRWGHSDDTKVRMVVDVLTSFRELLSVRGNWIQGKYRTACLRNRFANYQTIGTLSLLTQNELLR